MKVLLFCDPGIDDSIAIIYALLKPELELVGVVTSYGNVDKHSATLNAAYILSLANRRDIPLFHGASMPVTGEISPYYPEIHGEQGIGPLKVPNEVNVSAMNLGGVFELIHKYHHDLVIVDVGRSTSLAAAFLLDHDTMKLVKEFHLMGGAFLVPGNVTPIAEANFHGDPMATNVVLSHGSQIFITPLNVTQKAIITKEFINHLTKNTSNFFKELYEPLVTYYANAYSKLLPGIAGAPFHDLFTVYSIFHREKIDYMSKKVTVSTDDGTRGKSYADFRSMEHEMESNHHIAIGFDYEHYVEEIYRTLSRNE